MTNANDPDASGGRGAGHAARVLRVALLGAGMISQKHLLAWRKARGARLVAVVDPVLERAQARAREFEVPAAYASFDALLEREAVDAVDIVSSRESHEPLLRRALAAGLPALCEKPLLPSAAAAEALVADARGRARIMVNQNFRFRPYYQAMKSWIDNGQLGELAGCTIATRSSGLIADGQGRYPYIERQPFVRHEPRLMIEEVLIHRIDVARWLCGPLRLVAARARRACPALAGESEATLFFETVAGGVPVVVDGNFAAAGYPALSQERVEILGPAGRITLDDHRLRLHGPAPVETHYDDPVGAIQLSFDAAVQHFVDALAGGTPFLTEAAENVETLRLVEAAYAAVTPA